MRILVDLGSCEEAESGVGRRALALWPRVAEALRTRGGAVRILAPGRLAQRLEANSGGAEVDRITAFAGSPWRRWRRWNPELRHRASEWGATLIHQETLPLADPVNSIITIHDLRELHPLWRGSRRRRIMAGLLYPMQIPRVRGVVTVSEFMRSEITRLLQLSGDAIHVIPNAVDLDFFRHGGKADGEVLSRAGLTAESYWLHVGHREARKNLGFAVEVLAELDRRGHTWPLVLAGRAKRGYREPERLARKFGLSDRLRILEDFDDADLPALYRNARHVLLPSRYEGYGMTGPEAQAAGTPVLATAQEPFLELLGPDSCRPLEAEVWADHLVSVTKSACENFLARPDWDEVATRFVTALDSI